MLESQDYNVTTEEFKTSYFQFENKLKHKFPVESFISYFNYTYETSLISENYHKTLVTCRLPSNISTKNPFPYKYKQFEATTVGNPLKIKFAGTQLVNSAIIDVIATELIAIEFVAVPILLVLLVFAFGGIVAALVPIALILWTLDMTFVALHLVTIGFRVTNYTEDVTLIFGIGLAIDFAIFMQLRYTEERSLHKNNPSFTTLHAIDKLLKTSGRTVTFSAISLASILAGALQFNEFFVSTMVLAIIFPAIFAGIGALTFVPVLYILLGDNLYYLNTDYINNYVSLQFNNLFFTKDGKLPSIRNLLHATNEYKQQIEQDIDLSNLKQQQDEENRQIELMQTDTQTQSQPNKQLSVIAFEDKTIATTNQIHMSSKSNKIMNLATITTEAEDNDFIFQFILFVIKYAYLFFFLVMSCLVALFVIFVIQVKFSNTDIAYVPLHSDVRYVIDSSNNDFKSAAISSMNIFLQTNEINGTQDKLFLIELDKLTKSLSNVTHVTNVMSLMNIKAGVTLHEYLTYYSDPYNPYYYPFTSTLIKPFYLTDFNQITQLTVSLSLQLSDSDIPKTVHSVRNLVKNGFKNSIDGSSMLLRSGVTGNAAKQYDVVTDLKDTLPKFIAIIVILLFFFVLLLTRSIFIPFKALFVSIFSIFGSFCFLMFVYQDNHGSKTLQFYNPAKAIDPLQLIFIFVVAFGLSLDYEVFLMGRIQEQYEKTGDNNYSIAKGISTSSKSVTLAALLLCVAIAGLIKSQIMLLQQISMGIGLTILIDATIIRMILVPSILAIVGKSSWWCPEPLKTWLKNLGLEES